MSHPIPGPINDTALMMKVKALVSLLSPIIIVEVNTVLLSVREREGGEFFSLLIRYEVRAEVDGGQSVGSLAVFIMDFPLRVSLADWAV